MKEEPDFCGKFGFTSFRRRRHGAPLPPAALVFRFVFMTEKPWDKKFFSKMRKNLQTRNMRIRFKKIFFEKQEFGR